MTKIKKTHNIIVFEGLDGSGKSTLIKALNDHFQPQLPTLTLQGLGSTKLGQIIRNIFLRPNQLHSTTKNFLSLSNMIETQEQLIKPFLKQHPNGLIFLDRWLASNYAYQLLHQNPFKDFQTHINRFFIKPLITIYLDIDPQEGLKRKQHQPNHQLDAIESQSLNYFNQVKKGFFAFMNQYASSLVLHLNADNTKGSNFRKTKKIIERIKHYA